MRNVWSERPVLFWELVKRLRSKLSELYDDDDNVTVAGVRYIIIIIIIIVIAVTHMKIDEIKGIKQKLKIKNI